MTIRIRHMRPDDTAFVVDAWVETFRDSHAAGVVPMEFYQQDYRKYVAWILEQRRPAVLLAYDADADVQGTDLLGFLVYEDSATFPAGRVTKTVGPVVHYVYVKQFARGNGLARALFDAAKIDQRGEFHHTFKGQHLLRDKIPRARWSPLIARYPKTPTREGDPR